MKFIIFWKPIIWLALICYSLFLPANNLPVKPFINIPHFDKMVHFALFFGLCLLLFRPFKILKLKYFFLAPAIAIILAALLESFQHFISSTRSSDFFDFLANLAGISFSLLFFYFFVSERKWEKLF
ncbi:MAG: VanZ family protein [Prolixibacteraceae bacterium]|jgi:VanZ family protein|nr:VanZ family protein [Prolixibacteraceae bacterium]MBT6766228.1 VanZ family protein [Prolixibacteraceae bacterium]MBT7000558.1 VanZ family protein [Prolixibacteraceae bacterium]MBT7393506.1 VanZ family protein [Prolixibacteraceae bacterium]